MHLGIDRARQSRWRRAGDVAEADAARRGRRKVDVRSRVVVKITLTTSSWANSFRSIIARNSSCVASSIAAGVSSSHVVAPRRPRNCADLM